MFNLHNNYLISNQLNLRYLISNQLNLQINGILAAVDATKEPDLASRFAVRGYPTLKYFSKGEYQYDAGHARQEEQIVRFIEVCREIYFQ